MISKTHVHNVRVLDAQGVMVGALESGLGSLNMKIFQILT
jgi:hypothetical protein